MIDFDSYSDIMDYKILISYWSLELMKDCDSKESALEGILRKTELVVF